MTHSGDHDWRPLGSRLEKCSIPGCTAARRVPAERLKEEGIQAALWPDQPYNERFNGYVEELPSGTVLTSEKVTGAVGLPYRPDGKVNRGKVGALMNGLARRAVLERIGTENGKRAPSHAAMLTVWRRK